MRRCGRGHPEEHAGLQRGPRAPGPAAPGTVVLGAPKVERLALGLRRKAGRSSVLATSRGGAAYRLTALRPLPKSLVGLSGGGNRCPQIEKKGKAPLFFVA